MVVRSPDGVLIIPKIHHKAGKIVELLRNFADEETPPVQWTQNSSLS